MAHSIHWLLVLCAVSVSGCSSLIAGSGLKLNTLTTREQVHAELGAPTTSGVEDNIAYDIYHSRRKFCDQLRAYCNSLGFGWTFGLSELIALPVEVGLLAWTTTSGRNLRFGYDTNGIVETVLLDGETPVDCPNLKRWGRRESNVSDESHLRYFDAPQQSVFPIKP